MDKMPKGLKNKLRRIHRLIEQADGLYMEVCENFDKYGVDVLNLREAGDDDEVQTEALTFIISADGDVENNIKDIEKVFLHYVNSKRK